MAQQSARRGWDNQGSPLCLEHAWGDLDPVRELLYRPAAVFLPHQGRTDDSIRPRAATTPTFSLAWRGASTDGERSFAEACLNGEVAPISAISGTPTVKRTPRGPGQALGPSPAPVTFRPTGRLKGVFCLAPSCLFLRGRANRPTTPIRGALQPTVAGDPWVIYRSRDFVDRDFVGDAAQRAALRCRGETAGFEQGRGLGVGNDRPRRQDRT